jgi:hypothetical protein
LGIESEAVCLTFRAPIVSSVGQHPDGEQRNALHLLVGRGELPMIEEVVARLLDHILHRDEGGVVVLKRLLQGLDRLFDRLTVLARGSRLSFRTNEAVGEDRPDEFKDLFADMLGTHDTPSGLTFTSPLAITVRLWGPNERPDLFPGRSLLLCLKPIEVGP